MRRALIFPLLFIAVSVNPGCSDDDSGSADTQTADTVTGDTASDAAEDVATDTSGPADTAADSSGDTTAGEACLTKDDCRAGEICVNTVPGSRDRSCVAPQCPSWDPLTAVSAGWYRKNLDDATDNALVCNDGCPYAYYVRPGVAERADNWLIFFKGGGGCASDEQCADRWATGRTWMVNNGPNWTPTGQNAADQDSVDWGIFARGRGNNPFDGWSQVYLHYCSSDTHTGDVLAEDNALGIPMRGSALGPAVISELLDDNISDAIPVLKDAKRVLIFGGSSGSVGARGNMDRLADLIHASQQTAGITKAVMKGFLDSGFFLPVGPNSFIGEPPPAQQYANQVPDDDCAAAHPNALELCYDAGHMAFGRGIAAEGQIDAGHLKSVESLFINMDQFDGPAVARLGPAGQCVRQECQGLDSCPAGGECFNGICLRPMSCVPEVCKELPCYGTGGPPACLEEQGEHDGRCDVDDDCLPGEGEVCLNGFCGQDTQSCEVRGCDEGAGFACGIDGVCAKTSSGADDCPEGYQYNVDSLQCREGVGCSDANPCPSDLTNRYVCVPRKQSVGPQLMSHLLRERLSDPALGGGYSTRRGSHTSANYAYFYDTHFGSDSISQVLGRWYFGGDQPHRRVKPADPLPLPQRVEDLVGMDFTGFPSLATFASTCGGDATSAKAFLLCGAQQDCKPLDGTILGGARTTASGTGSYIDGEVLEPAQRVVLRMVDGVGDCAGEMVTIGRGEHITLTFDNNATLDVALPEGSAVSATLWVSSAGATFAQPELTQLLAAP
ncbi:MAG: hypothetical protein ACI9MR_001934 [Myxococcota bacterium]|jgi:hypothetical protein